MPADGNSAVNETEWDDVRKSHMWVSTIKANPTLYSSVKNLNFQDLI